MEISNAKNTIANLFNNTFDKVNFTSFISNLLNSASFTNQTLTQNNQIHDQFKEHIESLERLTTFNDGNGIEIDVLIVTLLKDTALDRARTMQRNFIASHLSNNNKDAALVAFVFPGSPDWRFSLISMESRYEGTKLVNESSPAKRWSFLVGKHEGSHTAQRQLLDILANDNEDPSLEELIEAFNIETVSKEFYEKYRELFDRMTEDLKDLIENDYEIEKDFREKQIKPRDFARKTMGQIAFLYFLQKKGWFGVKPGAEWGTGVRNFVRVLFKRREDYGNNFFNDVLEPLFYEALAQDRGPGDHYTRLKNVRMPFLNGGLFEPLNGYSWQTTSINIPDEFFSNKTLTNEGDTGDGILDIFDRYNFTVNESEPLDMEVAVDPEMLGKVFENLLPEHIRKGKAAYYTPRPIVHFMSQESLINYLDTEMSHEVKKELIEAFIRDDSSQLDLCDEIKSNAKKIDKLLANIKVCDPAVGSGAFPLGLLNEIVKARAKIGEYTHSENSIYDLKLHAISNSIYGVDLDPGAIEIAKLRLWLSLVVEEDSPSPLPNLDHKIMQGNSLVSEYEGMKLFDDNFLHNAESNKIKITEIENNIHNIEKVFLSQEYTSSSKAELSKKLAPLKKELNKRLLEVRENYSKGYLFSEESPKQKAQRKTKKLRKLIAQHILTHSQSIKQNLKEEISQLKWDLIEITIKESKNETKLAQVQKLRLKRINPFFIWKLEFGEVFKDNGGFDLIIGNPPYIKEYTERSAFDGVRHSYYYQGKMDLWYLFACNGLDILKEGAVLSFIATNNWVTNFGASKMRDKIIKDARILALIDFNNFKIFDSAGIQTMIMMFQKDSISDNYEFDYRKLNNNTDDLSNVADLLAKNNNGIHEIFSPIVERSKFKDKSLIFNNPVIENIINKIQQVDSFNLSNKEVANGIHSHHDNVTKRMLEELENKFNIGSGIFSLNNNELNNLSLQPNEQELIKPYFTSKELFRYYGTKDNKNWIIYTSSYFKNPKNIIPYPNIKRHLDQFSKVISSDNKPYGLHRTRDENFFKGEKIISLRKCSNKPVFTYTDYDCYVPAAFYVIKTSKISQIALTGFLNSSICTFWLKFKGKMQGTNYQIDKEPLVNIPIPSSFNKHEGEIIELVNQIISIKNQNNEENCLIYEKKIDLLIYDLYELTEEEIEIIENSTQ
mgnify:CR=1 FL=1